MMYHNAMLAIQELLDGTEWTHETLEQLAEIMRKAGYRIRDLDDKDGDEAHKPPLVALADAFDAQWNAISGLEPESVVERRLYNAICKAIGLPPRCTIEEDAPARLGDEIAEQERSMEAVNDGFERLAKSIESIR